MDMDDSKLTPEQKEDPVYLNARCVHYMNKLVGGLGLDIPIHFEDLGQIQVSHLVEIHCRLIGLNFNEYTPNPERPWKDIEDIILSLQDRYGLNNFHHLNALLISQYNPRHLVCLLQVFNEIYDYHVRKGRILPTPRNADSTILASSYHTEPDTSLSSSTATSNSLPRSDTHGHTQSPSPLNATLRDHDFESMISSASSRSFKDHVFAIPFTDSELDFDIDLDLESFETSDESSNDETDLANVYLGGNADSSQGAAAAVWSPQELASLSPIPKTKTQPKTGESSKKKMDKSTKAYKGAGVVSSPQGKMIPTATSSPIEKENSEPEPGYYDSQTQTPSQSQSHLPIDDEDTEQSDIASGQGASKRHRVPSWCDQLKFGTASTSTPCRRRPSQRCDAFGNPIREKFPYYASSIIKPTCHPSSFIVRRRKHKPAWRDVNTKQNDEEKCGETEARRGGRGVDGKKAKRSLSSTICSKVLKQVMREMPECHLDKATLKKLHGKCKAHLRSIANVAFDPESVANQVADKLKIFLEQKVEKSKSKSQLSVQVEESK